MRKTILITVIVILFSGSIFGQENKILLGIGYPINLTNHWLVDKWEKPFNFDFRFIHNKNILVIGGGINYSKFNVSWFRYYDSDMNTILNFNPYVQVGINLDKKIVSMIPHFDLGYSAILTDIEIYSSGKGGFYSAVGLDCNFNISEKIQLGIGANYSLILNKLDFEYEGAIQHDFIPTEDDIMKTISLNLNIAYRLK